MRVFIGSDLKYSPTSERFTGSLTIWALDKVLTFDFDCTNFDNEEFRAEIKRDDQVVLSLDMSTKVETLSEAQQALTDSFVSLADYMGGMKEYSMGLDIPAIMYAEREMGASCHVESKQISTEIEVEGPTERAYSKLLGL